MSQAVADDLRDAVAELRALFPEWRLGQTLVTLVTAAGGANASDIWEIEDDRLLKAARQLVERNRLRGMVVRYDRPTEPGAEGDWGSLQ